MIRPLSMFSAITTLLVMLFILPTQATAKAYRVAWITPVPVSEGSAVFDTFRHEMRQRGYVEGENLTIELRSVGASPELISGALREVIRLNVDIIVTVAHPTIQAAQQATQTIPIVMFGSGDPVATGTVASLARPGGNITGISHLSPELSGKRLELLKEALPGLARVAVLWNATNPTNAPQVRDTKVAAQALGIELHLLEVRAPEHLEGAFQAAARGRAGALITLDDLFIFTQRTRIVALAAKSRLPAIYGWPHFVEAGGLMSYSPDLQETARRTAAFVDKILKGARPAELPIEQPTKFDLVINLKTAKVLGLMLSSSLRLRADRVIE